MFKIGDKVMLKPECMENVENIYHQYFNRVLTVSLVKQREGTNASILKIEECHDKEAWWYSDQLNLYDESSNADYIKTLVIESLAPIIAENIGLRETVKTLQQEIAELKTKSNIDDVAKNFVSNLRKDAIEGV